LRDKLWAGLKNQIENLELNGHPTQRLPHNLSFAIPGIESRSLVVQLKNMLSISTGSACTTSEAEPSHVILALGYGEERAYNSVRFGLGRVNKESDVDFAIESLKQGIHRIRKLR